MSQKKDLIKNNSEFDDKQMAKNIQNQKDSSKYENFLSLKNLIEKIFLLQKQQERSTDQQQQQQNDRNIIQKIYEIISLKSNSCTHQHGCIDNLYLKTLRGFLISYIGYCGLSVLQVLKKKNFQLLFNIFFRTKTLRFTLFLTVMNFWVNSVQCILRNKIQNFKYDKSKFTNQQGRNNSNQFDQSQNQKLNNQNDKCNIQQNQNDDKYKKATEKQQKYITFLAGSIAGFFALATQPNSQRKTWVIFTLTRCLDFLYNSLIINKKIPQFKGAYVLLFSLINMLTVYAYACDNSQVFSGLTKFYTFVYNPSKTDEVFMCATQMEKYRWLKDNGIVEGRAKNLAYAKSLGKHFPALFEKGNIKI